MIRSRRAASALFARKGEGGATGGAAPGTGASADASTGSRRSIVCAACGAKIAPADAAISVAGSHFHTFMNPGGFVYEIVCYREAEGARRAGAPSSEWSWFPGYLWQVAVCTSCAVHLGWSFGGEGGSFFGLVRDRISESSE
jgi:hypothetical protein